MKVDERGFMVEFVLIYLAFFIVLFVLWGLTGTVIPSAVLLVLAVAYVYWPRKD